MTTNELKLKSNPRNDLITMTERALHKKVFPPHKERGQARLPDPELIELDLFKLALSYQA